MKVVIAPDSFKESLTAKQVCDAIQAGLARVWHDAKFVAIPVADGGEGTVQSLVDATQGRLVEVKVMGPQGKRVEAFYGMLGDNQTAVIEMAAASGLHHVPLVQRDPKLTTSFGTGELIRHALDQGVTKLIIGLGGSATNDGGVGMLAALGARFTNADGDPIQLTGGGLRELTHIDLHDVDPRLQHCDIVVACDVPNPLCGDKGASAVFGPQKGATPEDVQLLDGALRQFGLLTEKVTGKMVLESAGAGAAGGMGAALLAYAQARLRPGIEIVLETVQLAHQVSDADLVAKPQWGWPKLPNALTFLCWRCAAVLAITIKPCTSAGSMRFSLRCRGPCRLTMRLKSPILTLPIWPRMSPDCGFSPNKSESWS